MSRGNSVLSLVAASLLLLASAAEAAPEPKDAPKSEATAKHGDHHPDGMAMTADLLLARPLGLAVTVVGAAVFLVALPFAAISGDVSTSAHRLVEDPARYTFTRPLGHLH